MPAYNSSEYISSAIQSVINQSCADWELIIVDDSSTDNTLDICLNFSKLDGRIKVLKNENFKGAAGARNTGVFYAQFRFICFLDSDDAWCESKLSSQLKFFQENNNCYFVYSDYYVVSSGFDFLKSHNFLNDFFLFKAPDVISYEDLKKTCSIGCLTACYDTVYFGKQYFPYIAKEDYALWLKLLSGKNICAFKVPVVSGFYRLSSGSLSSNKIKEFFRQARVLLQYGDVHFLQLPYYLFFYVCAGLFKYKSK